jgi:hypothetical protein
MTIRQKAKDAVDKILDIPYIKRHLEQCGGGMRDMIRHEAERYVNDAMDRVSGCTREQAVEASKELGDYVYGPALPRQATFDDLVSIILSHCGERSMPAPKPDREWTQEELRKHVATLGITPEDGEVIPQAVKYIAYPQPPLTDTEREWALRVIDESRNQAPNPVLGPEEYFKEHKPCIRYYENHSTLPPHGVVSVDRCVSVADCLKLMREYHEAMTQQAKGDEKP